MLEGIDELAASIKKIGLLHPPIVQEQKGKYRLVIGQRRLEAVRQLGWKNIPVQIRDTPYDLENATIASVSENLQRKPVVAGDMADACDYLRRELGSIAKVAKVLGVSTQTVRKYLGYKAVPAELKKLVPKTISVSDAIRIAQYAKTTEAAVSFAEQISKLPKPARERHFLAFMESPESSWDTLTKRADALRYKTALKIYLPEDYARGLAKASVDRKQEPESLAQAAVIGWLKEAGYSS